MTIPPVVTTTYKTVRVKYTKYGEWFWYVGFSVSFGYRAIPTNDRNCRVVKLWVNDGVVFDLTNRVASAETPNFYLGTEDQPFYRGQMILNFPYMNLGSVDKSVSVPKITAEIWDNVSLEQHADFIGYVTPGDVLNAEWDSVNQRLLVATDAHIIKEVIQDDEQRTIYAPGLNTARSTVFAPWQNFAFNCAEDGVISEYSLETGTALTTFGDSTGLTSYTGFAPWTAALAQELEYGGQIGTALLVDTGDGFQHVAIAHSDRLLYGKKGLTLGTLVCITRGEVRQGSSDFLASTTTAVKLARVGMPGSGGLTLADVGTDIPPDEPTLAVSVDVSTIYTSTGIKRVHYLAADNTALVLNATTVTKIRMDGTVIWTTSAFTTDGAVDLQSASQMTTGNDIADMMVKSSGSHAFTLINTSTGELDPQTYNPSDITIDDDKPYIWDSRLQTIYPLLHKRYLQINLPGASALTVDTICRTLAQRAGYDPGDIFIDGLDTIPIDGYVVGNQTTLEGVLDVLSQLYSFTYGEVGGQLVIASIYDGTGEFVETLDVAEDMLAVLQEGSKEKITTVINGDANLPLVLTVTYTNINNHYNLDTQTAQRQREPLPTTGATQPVHLYAPVVTTKAQMLAALYRALYIVWAGSLTHTIRLPTKYLALVPSDGLRFVAYDIEHRATVVSATINADFSITLSMVERQTTILNPTYPTQDYGGPADAGAPKPARAIVLDLPDVDPSQSVAGSLNLMIGASGYQPSQFNGARFDLATSDDPNTYQPVAQLDTETPMGSVISFDTPDPAAWTTDYAATITVAAGAIVGFAGCTLDEQLADTNLLAIGRDGRAELLTFGTAVDNGNGTWTLGRLMRGLHGTDTVINMMQIGDPVVFYSTLNRLVYPVDDFTAAKTYFYRAVPHGMAANEVQHYALIPNADSKRPHAPVHFSAITDDAGNVDISFVRRDRWGGPLVDGTDAIPEPIGRTFSIDIFNADWSTIKRRVDTFTMDAGDPVDHWSYSVDDQVFDGLDSATSFNLAIYQMDPEIGRGWAGVETVAKVDGTTIELDAVVGGTIGSVTAAVVAEVDYFAATVLGSLGRVTSAILISQRISAVVSGTMGHVTSVVVATIADPEALVIVGATGHVTSSIAVSMPEAGVVGGTMGHLTISIVMTDGSSDELTYNGDSLTYNGDTLEYH